MFKDFGRRLQRDLKHTRLQLSFELSGGKLKVYKKGDISMRTCAGCNPLYSLPSLSPLRHR